MKENYCILAGGCFWCIAMPYYELDGVVKVYSGYGGGKEVNPSYKEVKNQNTSHKECIKIVYDEEKVSFKEILEIYFNHINPFDSEGQFIDRGDSYTTAIFYRDEQMLEIAQLFINKIEMETKKKVAVQLLKETSFYLAEEEHQEYGLKNPLEIEKELIKSGRKK